MIDRIAPRKTALFLFNYSKREMYGVFESQVLTLTLNPALTLTLTLTLTPTLTPTLTLTRTLTRSPAG